MHTNTINVFFSLRERMFSNVLVETAGLCKLAVTLFTLELLLAGVHGHVLAQGGHVQEVLVAIGAKDVGGGRVPLQHLKTTCLFSITLIPSTFDN